MIDKYKKQVFQSISPLFDSGSDDYTADQYEARLKEHLALIKSELKSFKKSHKHIENIKIRVNIEQEGSYDDTWISSECYLVGEVPLTEEERKIVDDNEKIREEHMEKIHKEQLQFLLKKYPEFTLK